jgi:hypothetical protein
MLFGLQLHRGSTQAVAVTVEQDTLALAGGVFAGFDPIAPPSALPHSLDESQWATGSIASVVFTHHFLDGFTGFVGVVKWDGGDIMVEHVSFDDAMKKVATDETKFTINGSSGTPGICPG